MCIQVETGALIFAIINITGSSIGLLFMIGAMVYTNIAIADNDEMMDSEKRGQMLLLGMAVNAVLSVALCLVALAFAFAVILIKGVVQKRPGLVLSYFIYGTVKTIFLGSGGLVKVIVERDGMLALTVFTACLIQGLILTMIYMTYKKFSSGVVYQYGHKQLVEDMPSKF